MAKMKKITVGVIGAGRIGKLHIENILQYFPHVQIKSVADPLLDEIWAAHKSIQHLYRDAEPIFSDKNIDAVLICSPVALHVPHIIAAAHSQKHIFCEKPIALNLQQIADALRVVKKSNVILQVGFNRRFDANFAKIKSILQNQTIGKPHVLRITSRDPDIPSADYLKSSSGMFLDMTIHDFDMARFLLGSEIEEIYASGGVLIHSLFKEYNDIDTAVVQLKFTDGSLGVIDNSRRAAYGYDQRVEVFGSLGAVHADNNKPTNTTISTEHGITTEKPLYFFLERYKESYIAELQAFFTSVQHNQPAMVNGFDGLMSIVAGLAATQSLQENRPVKINHAEWREYALGV
ncbi:MAG: hypothetical protein ACD_45C00332G0002 [uncultured bacterium]|nr:MAG: hypothetical protein ACD_45C00332G0002 [uncultured bacterium]